MKKATLLTMTALIFMSVVFCFFVTSTRAASKKTTLTPTGVKQTDTNPDFAFPVEVVNNSQVALSKALKQNDAPSALRAAINIDIADNLISNFNTRRSIAMFDSLAGVIRSPYAGLAYLLEARIYAEIYQEEKWVYDRRTLPVDFADPNPQTWSRQLFANKVTSLLQKAFNAADGSKEIPLASLPELIENSPRFQSSDKNVTEVLSNAPNLFTVYDFMVYQAIELKDVFGKANSNVLPFYPEAENNGSLSVTALLDYLIALHKEAAGLPLAQALITKARLLPSSEQYKQLMKDYKNYQHSDCGSLLLLELTDQSNDLLTVTEKVEMLRCQLESTAADSAEASLIQSRIDLILKPRFSISVKSPILVDTKAEIEVNAANMSKYAIDIYKIPYSLTTNPKIATIKAKGEKIATLNGIFEGALPLSRKDTLEVNLPGAGYYAFLPSASVEGYTRQSNPSEVAIANVTDITLTMLTDSHLGKAGVYVRSAATGTPTKGAKVVFTEATWKTPKASSTVYTDSEGWAESPYEGFSAVVSKGGSIVASDAHVWKYSPSDKKRLIGEILTDLSVYKPGDRLQFSIITYELKGSKRSILPGKSTEIWLYNANYEKVDSIKVTTDEFGRASGTFNLPQTGLLGSWSLEAQDMEARKSFKVAEYKAPTFFVSLNQEEVTDSINRDYACFRGIVKTYSGMPLADTAVRFKIDYSPWWWRTYNTAPASYGSEVTTDAGGNFEIILPLDNIRNTGYLYGSFSISAEATDDAGETVTSEPLRFSLAESSYLESSLSDIIEIKPSIKEITLPIKVMNASGFPVRKEISWKLFDASDKEFSAGTCYPPGIVINSSNLPSGKYTLKAGLKDEEDGTKLEKNFIVYRLSDKKPPISTPLWVPETDIVAREDAKETEINIGSSFSQNPILYIVSNSSGEVMRKWLDPKQGNFTIKVKSPADNEQVRVNLSAVDSLSQVVATVNVVPAAQVRKLSIVADVFRNSIVPGEKERWTFLIKGSDFVQGSIPAMAVMSNKSLDAIAPFNWNLSFQNFYYSNPISLRPLYDLSDSARLVWRSKGFSTMTYPNFKWITFGYNLVGSKEYSSIRVRGGNVMMKNMAVGIASTTGSFDSTADDTLEEVHEEMEVAYAMAESSADKAVAFEEEETPDQLREVEMPLAFFLPNISTNTAGELKIDFEVPNFNTEWKLQIAAYTPELISTVATFSAIAAKKVMVSMNAPQFLTTGDKINLRATVFNNSDSTLNVTGHWIVFNPVTGETIAKIDENDSETLTPLLPSANRVMRIMIDVPADLSVIGIKCFALSDVGSDGEQIIIPVIPSSQPVIESTTFYLSPQESSFNTVLPATMNGNNGFRSTLQYCDNPIWYVLTALAPTAKTESKSVIDRCLTLYSNAVGRGLMEKYPSLHQGLSMILTGEAGDSLLISNLQKDAELKSVVLSNTPWVNDAASETLRLSRLGSLLDSQEAAKEIADNINTLLKLQNNDGSWSWCEGMPPSLWITEGVILNLGLLKHAGYLPSDSKLDRAIKEAIKYCDSEEVNKYKKRVSSSPYPYTSLKQYLFARSFFTSYTPSSDFKTLQAGGLDALLKEWKNFDVFDKATTAIILKRYGYPTAAKEILESLRQYASVSKEAGMWFDNLNSGFMGAGKILTTARVLNAFTEITPADNAIPLLRQWLILQRQTQDWQEGVFSIDAIDAIFNSFSANDPAISTDRKLPVITIGNQTVSLDKIANLTGSMTLDLPLTTEPSSLTIQRQPGVPAWGGIISRYVKEASEVEAVAIPQMSIEKKLFVIDTDGTGTVAKESSTFITGNKVKVSLIIHTDRDMDYVVLTDQRAACMEPVEQLSGYSLTDGMWTYKENRDTSTTFFFSFLPKGTHVVSYDCFISQSGTFSQGIATLQSQYSPLLTAHSAGALLKVD